MVEPRPLIRVVVCTTPAPGEVQEFLLSLPEGSALADALRASGQPVGEAAVGVWGAVQPHDHVLADGDRVEVYRPLVVDPKVARRERFARQGARRAGLFSKQRVGAKAGY
jgi:putative ubiquitin-RnfH superfamily antitoxin RatB of RatAB toxin-antitoxin module